MQPIPEDHRLSAAYSDPVDPSIVDTVVGTILGMIVQTPESMKDKMPTIIDLCIDERGKMASAKTSSERFAGFRQRHSTLSFALDIPRFPALGRPRI